MSQVSYADQTDIFNPETFGEDIHLVGVGGIGSTLLKPLVMTGIRTTVHLWDFDLVEGHNIPCQMFRPRDIGRSKVDAAIDILSDYDPPCTLVPHNATVDETTPFEGIVISAVDNMSTRQAIWKAVSNNFTEVPLLLDGRLGGESVQLLSLAPSDFDTADKYAAEWLFSDAEASPLPCAARTSPQAAPAMSALMLNQLTRFHRGLEMKYFIDFHVGSSMFLAYDPVRSV